MKPLTQRYLAIMVVFAAVVGTVQIGESQGRSNGRVRRAQRPVPNQYIVVLADNQDADAVAIETEAVHRGRRQHVFRGVLKGFSARLTPAAADRLARDPRVRYVEEDGVMSVSQVTTPWGLDRIDQRPLPLDGVANFGALGTGVIVHVIDTGIRTTHQQFGGRAFIAGDYVDDDLDDDPSDVGNDDSNPLEPDGADCNGHGTHVAATIGGTTFGVARNVTIYAHRVFLCNGSGATSSVIAAVDAVTADVRRPAVANMSLSGSASDALDEAIRRSIASGVTYVVAAGNNSADAQYFSPARVAEALTVGATSSNDARASFSNYGGSVDVFAPGASIESAWRSSDTATATASGTSMATPHVAGVAALYLEERPEMSPAEVHSALVASATPNIVVSPGAGSPNRLLYSDLMHTTAPAINLLRPDGGANILGGVPYTIAWEASDPDGLEAFDVLLSTDGGVSYQPIADCAGLDGSQWQCAWVDPNPVTTTARIRVAARDMRGDTAFDQSSANFSIVTRPELVTVSVSDPPEKVAPGAVFSLSDTVRNTGNTDAGGSVTKYYLSLDAIKSVNDVVLSGSRAVPALAPGAESSGITTVTVSSTMPVGSYTLFACADSTSLIVEADEANNCLPSPALLTVALADLTVTTFSDPPTAAVPGTGFSVTHTVRNSSAVTAGASTSRFYFSTDAIKNAGDVLLSGTRAVAILAAGATSTGTTTVTIPSTAALGTYRLLACADDQFKVPEADEANNCLASSTVVLLALPDLVQTAISNPPAAAAPGATFVVTTSVNNPSPVTAAKSSMRFYLSINTAKDAGDVLLSGTRSVAALAAGTASSGTTTVTVPATTALGTYRVLACADDVLQVKEADESNNCLSSGNAVLLAFPELVTTAISTPPTATAPGAAFSLTTSVHNPSPVTAGKSTLRFYLSTNAVKDTGDVLLSGSRSVAALAAGTTSSGSTTVTVPATTALGTYRVLACADDALQVKEADESNNCLSSGSAILLAFPELVPTAISTPPVGAAPGTTFSVATSVNNPSPVTAGKSTLRYYLSTDAAKDAGDVLLSGTRSVGTLAAGATSTGNTTVTVPATTALGTYRVLACADDVLQVKEADEGNNCMSSANTLVVGWPDLVITAVSNPPAHVTPGGSLAITDTALNQGTISAGPTTTRYYLSSDAMKDSSDTLLAATRAVGVVGPSATSQGSATLTVPAATPWGSYVVLACADDLIKVVESDETNNCRASANFEVSPPNTQPVAHAGRDQDVVVGTAIQLDGLASTDADANALTYAWTILAKPEGSVAALSDAVSPSPGFTVDAPGQYVLQLIVHDGREFSRADVTTVATGATRFAALGDTGLGDAGQYAGASALKSTCDRSGCAFAILLGDNIYQSGVTSVDDEQFATKFEMPYAPIDVPFYAVLGNHDYGNGGVGDEFEKGQFQIDYTAVSSKWRMPAAYYRFISGDIEFFALDTNMQRYGQDAAQRADMAGWLQQSTSRWKIALGHHPYRSNGSHGNAGHYDGTSSDEPFATGERVKSFMEDVVCGQADLMLSGHDHNLQWLQPNGTCAGTDLIVSGAGSKPKSLRSPTSVGYNESYFQAAQLGFVYFVATANQLTAEFIDENGATLYVRTLTKPQ